MHFTKSNNVNHRVQLNGHVGYASKDFTDRLATNPMLIENIFNIRKGMSTLNAEKISTSSHHVWHDSVWKFSMDGKDYCVKFTRDNQNDEINARYFLTMKLAKKYGKGLVEIANCHAGILDKENQMGILMMDYYPYEKWGKISSRLSLNRAYYLSDLIDGAIFNKEDRKQLIHDGNNIRSQASSLPSTFERLKYVIFKVIGFFIGIEDIKKDHAFIDSEKKLVLYDLQCHIKQEKLERKFVVN